MASHDSHSRQHRSLKEDNYSCHRTVGLIKQTKVNLPGPVTRHKLPINFIFILEIQFTDPYKKVKNVLVYTLHFILSHCNRTNTFHFQTCKQQPFKSIHSSLNFMQPLGYLSPTKTCVADKAYNRDSLIILRAFSFLFHKNQVPFIFIAEKCPNVRQTDRCQAWRFVL